MGARTTIYVDPKDIYFYAPEKCFLLNGKAYVVKWIRVWRLHPVQYRVQGTHNGDVTYTRRLTYEIEVERIRTEEPLPVAPTPVHIGRN